MSLHDELKALHEAASPAPWDYRQVIPCTPQQEADSLFVVGVRNAMPVILAALALAEAVDMIAVIDTMDIATIEAFDRYRAAKERTP